MPSPKGGDLIGLLKAVSHHADCLLFATFLAWIMCSLPRFNRRSRFFTHVRKKRTQTVSRNPDKEDGI